LAEGGRWEASVTEGKAERILENDEKVETLLERGWKGIRGEGI